MCGFYTLWRYYAPIFMNLVRFAILRKNNACRLIGLYNCDPTLASPWDNWALSETIVWRFDMRLVRSCIGDPTTVRDYGLLPRTIFLCFSLPFLFMYTAFLWEPHRTECVVFTHSSGTRHLFSYSFLCLSYTFTVLFYGSPIAQNVWYLHTPAAPGTYFPILWLTFLVH